MKQNHTASAPKRTGDVWPCRIVTTGNPNIPANQAGGLRHYVVFPNGTTSLSYYRYHTAQRIVEDYNATQTS